jgi:hypothetical protein
MLNYKNKVGLRFRLNLTESVFLQNKRVLETLTTQQKKALKEKYMCEIFVVSVDNKIRLVF